MRPLFHQSGGMAAALQISVDYHAIRCRNAVMCPT